MVSGATVAVPVGAVSLTVTGIFSLPYQIAGSTSWVTDFSVTGKTATQFVLSFAVPAPAGSTFDYSVITISAPVAVGAALLAGDIITNIRDEIPDPMYDAITGLPLPDTNGGLFRVSTLYGWLDDGVRIMARACGAIITDWTALRQAQRQPWYAVDAFFGTITDGFSNQWPLDTVSMVETDFMWPSTNPAAGQGLWGFLRKRTDHLEFGMWPVPVAADPLTTLSIALGVSGDTAIVLASALNFLSFGYVKIDSEIIQYQQVSGTSLTVLSRGVCGTSPAAHLAGAAVVSLGLWLKGTRSPARIVNSLSAVELPFDLVSDVKTYLLARCRGAENEFAERKSLMDAFDKKTAELRADPTRQENQGQIRAFGEPRVGPLAWQGQVVRPAFLISLLPFLERLLT